MKLLEWWGAHLDCYLALGTMYSVLPFFKYAPAKLIQVDLELCETPGVVGYIP